MWRRKQQQPCHARESGIAHRPTTAGRVYFYICCGYSWESCQLEDRSCKFLYREDEIFITLAQFNWFKQSFTYVMEAKVLALQVDHVASPTTPREGLIMKPL